MTTVSADGKSLSIDPEFDRTSLPGANKKVAHPLGRAVAAVLGAGQPACRPTFDKKATESATRWPCSARRICAMDDAMRVAAPPGPQLHAFQYPDWLVEGDDLLVASRTAFDDGQGGATRARRELSHVPPVPEIPQADDGRRRAGEVRRVRAISSQRTQSLERRLQTVILMTLAVLHSDMLCRSVQMPPHKFTLIPSSRAKTAFVCSVRSAAAASLL